jgi:hypothetical protein
VAHENSCERRLAHLTSERLRQHAVEHDRDVALLELECGYAVSSGNVISSTSHSPTAARVAFAPPRSISTRLAMPLTTRVVASGQTLQLMRWQVD